MYFSERVSARPPGLPVSFYIPIDFDFIQRAFIYYPSADTCLAYALALIAGLLQYHSQPIQRHRALNTALYDQFIANLGGSHKLTK